MCNESYEAEDSTDSRDWSEDSRHLHNGSYMDAGGRGAWISWDISDVPPGEYELSVYYANGGAEKRPVTTYVNGRAQDGRMTFPSTKDWSRWQWESQVVSVDEWDSTLTLEVSEERGGPNIDYIELSDKEMCG
ncbi:MAG: carbohydrate-binding domain-containing protein [Nannocystaceae bacterium]